MLFTPGYPKADVDCLNPAGHMKTSRTEKSQSSRVKEERWATTSGKHYHNRAEDS